MEGMEHTRNHGLLYTAEPMPTCTHRDCDHVYRANRIISQMWSQCWEGSRHDPPSRKQKLSSFDHCLQRENECSLIKFHQICKPLLCPSSMPNSKWPTQDQFDGNLLYWGGAWRLSHNALVGPCLLVCFCFDLTELLSVMWCQVLCFHGISVFESVCLCTYMCFLSLFFDSFSSCSILFLFSIILYGWLFNHIK